MNDIKAKNHLKCGNIFNREFLFMTLTNILKEVHSSKISIIN